MLASSLPLRQLLTWNASVIFSVTLVLTLMIAFAPPGIQNLCAQYVGIYLSKPHTD